MMMIDDGGGGGGLVVVVTCDRSVVTVSFSGSRRLFQPVSSVPATSPSLQARMTSRIHGT